MSKAKAVPAFKTEAEERAFWEKHDSTDYVDWSKARNAVFPKLKPSTTWAARLKREFPQTGSSIQ